MNERNKSQQRDTADPIAGFGLLLLRVAAGGFLLPHGLGKLFGWFGGPGVAGFAGELKGFGLPLLAHAPAPLLLALIQSALGLLVLVGAWTRISASLSALFLAVTVVLTFTTAPTWFWMNRGIEYPLFWVLALTAVAMVGPGPFSLDCWTVAWRPGLRRSTVA